MTRIYSFSLEKATEDTLSFMMVMVAHRDSRRAARVAMTEARRQEGPWRIVHLEARRTGIRIPQGEVLGSSGPFSFDLTEE